MPLRATSPVMLAANVTPAPRRVDARQVTLTVTDAFIIPAYRTLADATQRQEGAWTYFNQMRETGSFALLSAGYALVADAWAMAQLIKTGPITLFLRYDRFAYWPEARNATQRALDELLASHDPKDLAPETLAHDSVAGQGLTALERLLYDGPNPAAALRAPRAAGAWRAQVGLALAKNLNLIAHDVLKDWTAPNGVRAAIAANKGWNNLFADGAEAAHLLLTDLVTAFKTMHDVKLLPVLGADAAAAKPKLAEAWRSGRSARDLKLNLSAAHDMAKAFARTIPEAHQAQLETVFSAAEAALGAAPADMGEAAADLKRRPRVEAARVAIKAAQTAVAKVLPTDLGVTIGFNSLDGD